MTGATGPILAALVTPWLLYAGLGAVSVPVLIHLLFRRRFRRIRWAAIDFLLEAQRENRRRMRLREFILLALRCLAMLLIGLLLARPLIGASGLASMIGGGARRQHLFVLDDSYSMGFAPAKDSAFARAVEAVKRRARRLVETSPGDAVTVLRATEPGSPVAAVASLNEANLRSLFDRLDALKPTQRRAMWDDAVRAVAQAIGQEGGPADAVVHLVSDFQRADWTLSDPKARFAPLRELTGRDASVKLVLIDTGTDSADNLTLAALRAEQRQVVAGLSVRLVAEVANQGRTPSDPGQIEVLVNDASQPPVPLPAIEPGETVTVPFEVAFADVGPHALHVTLPSDGLEVDNHRYLAVEAVPAVRVLLVDGEPAGDPYDDEVHLLETALRPAGPVFSGIETTIIEDHELAAADLDAADLIMMCNVYRPDAGAVERLEQYVSAGGGLVVFLGDQVDAARYNDLLYRDGAGLLPAALGDVVAAPPDRPGVTFAPPEQDHPALRVLAGRENLFARGIHFWRYFTLSPCQIPADVSDEGAEASGAPTTRPSDAGPAQVVLRFADGAGSPAWVERPFGRGRVILLATACDNEWGDWPTSPSYLVSMLELTQYACRRGAWQESVTVGSPLRWPHRPDSQEDTATLRTPGYPIEADVIVPATADPQDSRFFFVWGMTDHAGIYELSVGRRGGGTETMAAAVNVDPAEGDLARVDRDRLLAMARPLPAEYVAGAEAAPARDDRSGSEFWPALLAAAVALLMIEQFLGWYFGKGG